MTILYWPVLCLDGDGSSSHAVGSLVSYASEASQIEFHEARHQQVASKRRFCSQQEGNPKRPRRADYGVALAQTLLNPVV